MKKYISLIKRGEIIDQFPAFSRMGRAPDWINELTLEDHVIQLDEMLRKNGLIDEDTEVAVTEDL